MMLWAVLGVSCDTQGEILMHHLGNGERNKKEDKPTVPDLQKHRGRPQLLQNLVFFFVLVSCLPGPFFPMPLSLS